MSINKLPNECLYMILDYFNGFEDLIRLSKGIDKVDYIDANNLWISAYTNWNDDNLFQLFPNLKVMDTTFLFRDEAFNFSEILKNNLQIKGLICMDRVHKNGYLENIEMCASAFNFDYWKTFRPGQLKQVSSYYFRMNELPSFIEYFPNLKRLNLCLGNANKVFYNGPNSFSLKILELGTSDFVEQFTGFHFMDFCPSLESAFFRCWAKDLYVDESIKNYNLRDLVIEDFQVSFSWPLLKKLLSKFPNLHHLAIRNFAELDVNNFDLEELIKLLTKLKILDLRGCNSVKQKSADFLSKYCVKKNRSIVIYYDCENEPNEWPKLVETYESICYGFDFMKHFFYKRFRSLPELIDE
ncbi:uncharacterized protein LOC128389078 [Panonychus citri]|uniref:uncharacterized protein LOC128389078 n=1 Tax=Panonychus citri TaxID=50023 RepID=UPI0023082E72|nr:uncharacterized protein LOC128389078 [Panonychus citri]